MYRLGDYVSWYVDWDRSWETGAIIELGAGCVKVRYSPWGDETWIDISSLKPAKTEGVNRD
jgi:hypothetical protein